MLDEASREPIGGDLLVEVEGVVALDLLVAQGPVIAVQLALLAFTLRTRQESRRQRVDISKVLAKTIGVLELFFSETASIPRGLLVYAPCLVIIYP